MTLKNQQCTVCGMSHTHIIGTFYHILFKCENGHFSIKNFDNNNQKVFVVKEIPLINDLEDYLQKVYGNSTGVVHSIDLGLLATIDEFLLSQKGDCQFEQATNI